MRAFRKLWTLLVFLCAFAIALSVCNASKQEAVEQINIYTTFYPLYAIAEMILADVPDARLNCLVQPQDGCLRSYSLSDWDYALLSRSADAIIAGGCSLESFEDLLLAMGESGPAVMEVLSNEALTAQQAVNADDSEAANHWQGVNPHLYMSFDGAIEIARSIAASLRILDPRYDEIYTRNLETATNRLKSLKIQAHERAGDTEATKVAILNEALVYVARDYEMEIALCFARESGDSLDKTSLESLIASIRENEAEVALIEKQAPQELLEALKGAGISVAALDTLSTRRADEGAEGYFRAQLENADALHDALQ